VATERGNLDDLLSELHVHETEAAADHPAVPEEALDLVGMRRGSDVEVFRAAAQKQIAHTSTDEVRGESRFLEAIEHLQRVGIDISTRERMFGTRDDGRRHHGERIISNAGLSTHTSPCSSKG
jgi:hypothetical protein